VVHAIVICHEGDVAERRPFAEHWAIWAFRPVIKAATPVISEMARDIVRGSPVETGNVKVAWAGRHWSIDVDDHK